MRVTLAKMHGRQAFDHYMRLNKRREKRAEDVYDDMAGLPMSREAYNALKKLGAELDRKAFLYSQADTRRDGWQAKRARQLLEQYGMAAAAGFLAACNWPIEDAADLLLDK